MQLIECALVLADGVGLLLGSDLVADNGRVYAIEGYIYTSEVLQAMNRSESLGSESEGEEVNGEGSETDDSMDGWQDDSDETDEDMGMGELQDQLANTKITTARRLRAVG